MAKRMTADEITATAAMVLDRLDAGESLAEAYEAVVGAPAKGADFKQVARALGHK